MKELRFHWSHELDASPDALWPLVADTDRFNRDTGVPPVEVLGTQENARRRLRLRRLGVPVEWEEEPFEWVRPRRFGVVRRYPRGPLVDGLERGADRLRPYGWGDAGGPGRRDSLELLLHAPRAGLTELRWELLCPSCRGAAATASTLRELDRGVHCDTCGIDFRTELDRSVEVTFAPSPSVRPVETRRFCVGGPQLSPHVVAQQLLGPAEERRLTLPLRPGAYRTRALGDEIGRAACRERG